MRVAGPIVIDGNFDDWKALGQGKWAGPTNLNVAVQVMDDRAVPARPGEAPYNFDAVEMFVDGRDPAFQYSADPSNGVFQIAVSPTAGQPTALVLAKSALQGLRAATARTSGGASPFRGPISRRGASGPGGP